MTGKERVLALFAGRETDRPALKLWSAAPAQAKALLHPDYAPVLRLALEKSDLFASAGTPCNPVAGRDGSRYQVEDQNMDAEWFIRTTRLRVPGGDLIQRERLSRVGKPGYVMEHFVKEPEQLERLLALPYEPFPIDLSDHHAQRESVGERGIVMLSIPHAAYAVYTLMGSETLAMMSLESRDVLNEAVRVYAERIRAHVKRALDAGLRAYAGELVIGWVGPELFLPPLMPPRDFDAWCQKPDSALISDIHEAGGYAWIHCHGKVGAFIRRFADMGCDMLNPIEPPPMGDVSLREAFALADGRMALEGNIEIGEAMTGTPERMRELVDRACDEAGERFVLGMSAGYMEVPNPPKRYIDNLCAYLEYGYARLEAMKTCGRS